MLDASTVAVVRALARGTDPQGGAALPADHLCQRSDVVRALGAVLAAVEGAGTNARGRRAVPGAAKAGLPWDTAEDEALAAAFARGESYVAIAERHERTKAAIEARLVRLGKIEPPPGLRLRERAAATP